MPPYAGLPDIDADDPFRPEAYSRYLQQQQQQQQPQYDDVPVDSTAPLRIPAPVYREHDDEDVFQEDYQRFHEAAVIDGGLPPPPATPHYHSATPPVEYYDEKKMVDIGGGGVQQRGYARYATPELEDQQVGGGQHDRSFDGPDGYQSTVDGHHEATATSKYFESERYDRQETPRRLHNLRTPRRRARARGEKDTEGEGEGSDFDEKQGYYEGEGEEEEEEEVNPHYGPAPALQLRRNRTRKRVALTAGNLVIDAPIPSRLASFLPRKGTEEFDRMRYTAVTCDPDDFDKNDYTLRPVLYNRDTELLIGVTMYNENEILLTRTLHGIIKNISHLCSRQKSKVWGKDGWKKIVVCIVADGRKVVHPRVLDCLAALGVYQKDVGKNKVDSKVVQAHIYEYTTQLSIDPELKFKGLEKGIVPTQIIFCMKERNAKKINSHRWLFNAFCPLLQPNVCVLLDVGTKPGPKSIYHLWKTFDLNSNVGGACGEICTMKGKFWTGLLNPMVAAQNFEYKMSNILDKPTESLFGYISVLPGAFSAYRYIALKNDDMGQGPLASYFKGETLAGHDADIFTSNMYLAEDRILCWELCAKKGDSWVLKFVKSAQGETDVPDTITEFISQRRRWLNGSFFAAMYAITHVFQLSQTEHSLGRKFALYLETFYNILNQIFAWFGIANYYIFFVILTSSLQDPQYGIKGIAVINMLVQYIYAGTLAATFLLSMGNRPVGAYWKYMAVMVIFSVLTTYMVAATVYCLVKSFQNSPDGNVFAQIVISMASTYGVWVLSSLLALDPWHLVTCMVQYMLCSPIWINVLNIYAFANLHDFSWGTKEDRVEEDLGTAAANKDGTVEVELPTDQADIDAGYDDALHSLRTRPKLLPRAKTQAEKDKIKFDYYASMRTNVVLIWALSNGILAAIILHGSDGQTFTNGKTKQSVYMLIILILVAIMAVFRFVASTAYLLVRMFAG